MREIETRLIFHVVAKQRQRKTMIMSLDSTDGRTSNIKRMLDGATRFYKNIFYVEAKIGFSLGDDFIFPSELITSEHNTILESPVFEKEVKKDVLSSYSGGAPGQHGLSFTFYQKCWEIVKEITWLSFRIFT